MADLDFSRFIVAFSCAHGAQSELDRLTEEFERRAVGGNDPPFPVWWEIDIGRHPDAATFVQALEASGCRIGGGALLLLSKFVLCTERKTLKLIVRSVAELGFSRSASRKEIYDRGLQLGFCLCPAEVGPQLRLDYRSDLSSEGLHVAMEDFEGFDRTLGGFYIENGDGKRWLGTDGEYPDYVWRLESRWVFVLP